MQTNSTFWWNWGICYSISEKVINITLRDLKNGERGWNLSFDIGAVQPYSKWKGFSVLEDTYAIDAGGFVATIDHIRATTNVVIPLDIMEFYNTIKLS